MNVENGLTASDEGYRCSECGSTIRSGEDAIVAMHAAVEPIEATGDPQAITHQYAGIYHPECFADG